MFSIQQVVTPSKTDQDGRMKLFSAIQLMQDCSEMWKNSEPAFLNFLLEKRGAQLLNFRYLEIERVPHLGEQLTCTTSVYGTQGAFGYRNTAIYDTTGRPCYLSWCIGAFVSADTGGLMRLPQNVAEQMKLDPQLPMHYGSRKIVLPEAEPILLPDIPVLRNDIDYNRHVNNAHYIRMALECLPEEFVPTTLRVEYKRPVAPGTVISPTLIMQPTVAYVQLRVGGILCCVVEFSR
ncbi:MAG: hypothetical protein IJB64_02935 [Akkermansia sp.]|nr:hypothetical protein [Akkermansia sp.]